MTKFKSASIVRVAHAVITADDLPGILAMGEALVRILLGNSWSFRDLLDAWADHRYRPTIRRRESAEHRALADLYDAAQRLRGWSNVLCFPEDPKALERLRASAEAASKAAQEDAALSLT